MVGSRIREARQAQHRSLANVATEAGISVATLSRIENDKQTLDVSLFLVLARVLKGVPQQFLDGADGADGVEKDPLARRIAELSPRDRTQLWQDLANEKRASRARGRRETDQQLGTQVEELLAQLDFLREELEAVKRRLRKR